jgi:hypothetical protein
MLQIFIALKNPSSWPGLNPRTFGPMVSTQTITPPSHVTLGTLVLIFCSLSLSLWGYHSGLSWKLKLHIKYPLTCLTYYMQYKWGYLN